jgi:hypothetical protein
VDNLSKKQKFIALTVIGSIVILATFIWSMIINLSQISVSNPIPDVKLPELSELESQQVEKTKDNQIPTETKDDNKLDNQNTLEQELDLEKNVKQ